MKYTKEELDKLIENAPRNEKGRPVLSEEDFMDNLKELPNGVESSEGKISRSNGFLTPLKKNDPRSIEIQKKGGYRAGEIYKERKRIAETIDIFLKKVDKDGKTMQEKIVEAMGLKAMDGCVGAAEFIRDTVGEKPTDNVNVDMMTEGDKALLQKVLKRMGYDESGDIKE